MLNVKIIDAVRHSLTGKQVLDLCFAVFATDKDAHVWLLVPKNSGDSFRKKIRVALSKERAAFAVNAGNGTVNQRQVRASRLFTVEMSSEACTYAQNVEAILVRYAVTRAHIQKQISDRIAEDYAYIISKADRRKLK